MHILITASLKHVSAVQFKNVAGLTAPVGLFGVFDGEHSVSKGASASICSFEPGIHSSIKASRMACIGPQAI